MSGCARAGAARVDVPVLAIGGVVADKAGSIAAAGAAASRRSGCSPMCNDRCQRTTHSTVVAPATLVARSAGRVPREPPQRLTTAMTDFGAKLREARERRGISLRADRRSHQDLDRRRSRRSSATTRRGCPAAFSPRAFVRSYAVEVGLDPGRDRGSSSIASAIEPRRRVSWPTTLRGAAREPRPRRRSARRGLTLRLVLKLLVAEPGGDGDHSLSSRVIKHAADRVAGSRPGGRPTDEPARRLLAVPKACATAVSSEDAGAVQRSPAWTRLPFSAHRFLPPRRHARDAGCWPRRARSAPRAHEQLALLVLLVDDPIPTSRSTAHATLERAAARAAAGVPRARRRAGRDARVLRRRGIEPADGGRRRRVASRSLDDADDEDDETTPERGDGAGKHGAEAPVGLPVKKKIKLAIEGHARAARQLIRDPNKLVAAAVLSSPKLTERKSRRSRRWATSPRKCCGSSARTGRG